MSRAFAPAEQSQDAPKDEVDAFRSWLRAAHQTAGNRSIPPSTPHPTRKK